MKKNTKTALLVLLIAFAALGLAGCKFGGTTLDELKDRYGLDAQVTYYANLGMFDDTRLDTKEVYLKGGSKAPNIGVDSVMYGANLVRLSRKDYVFSCWEWAETDAEGNVVTEKVTVGKEEYELPVSTGREVNFDTPIEAGEHWHLVAKWNADIKLEYVVATDKEIKYNGSDSDGNPSVLTAKNGDIVRRDGAGSDGRVGMPDITYVLPGYEDLNQEDGRCSVTFVEYYSDSACRNVVSWPYVMPTGDDAQDVRIYVKFIDNPAGTTWRIVKNVTSLNNMFTNMSGSITRYFYFACDVDYTGAEINLGEVRSSDLSVNAHIDGNGFKVTGLKYRMPTRPTPNADYSIFKKIGSNAVIENLTFENVEISANLNAMVSNTQLGNMYVFASEIEEGATFDNFTFSATLNLTNRLPDESNPDGIFFRNIGGVNGQPNDSHYIIGSYKGLSADADIMDALENATIDVALVNLTDE